MKGDRHWCGLRARCLVRIMSANLKKEGKKKALHIISLKTGIEALLNSSCVIYSSTVVCATFPSSSTLFFCFFSFHPHGLLLPPILLQGRQEAGLAASVPWRAGAVTVLEISSLWVLDTVWALRLYTVLTCLHFHILSSVWFKMFNRLVRSPIGKSL